MATPCTFCGWCAKKLKCEALIQQVNIALKSNPEWDLPQWHSSEMKTAKEMGLALKIARTLSDWCESVEFHAKEMAIKRSIANQRDEGISEADLLQSIELEYKENDIFPPTDVTEDWLKLIDYDPENVVKVSPIRPKHAERDKGISTVI